jgi:uncharacterized protein YndB with AHSA1/START domain
MAETRTATAQSLSYEFFIRTTPEALWAAITRPEQTRRYFFGTSVKTTLQPRTPFAYTMPDGSLASDGELIEAQPGVALAHTWSIRYDPSLADETSVVRYRIEPRGGACKLTVTHELDRAPKTAAHIASDSWSLILSGLKTWLETGSSLEVAPPAGGG